MVPAQLKILTVDSCFPIDSAKETIRLTEREWRKENKKVGGGNVLLWSCSGYRLSWVRCLCQR
ncbi:hypothetical protein CHS0354_014969, partial [Potamilus streckersoni]